MLVRCQLTKQDVSFWYIRHGMLIPTAKQVNRLGHCVCVCEIGQQTYILFSFEGLTSQRENADETIGRLTLCNMFRMVT